MIGTGGSAIIGKALGEKKKEEAKPAPPPAEPEDVKLLKEIRDLLKEQK